MRNYNKDSINGKGKAECSFENGKRKKWREKHKIKRKKKKQRNAEDEVSRDIFLGISLLT
jgi:hypothetical protein